MHKASVERWSKSIPIRLEGRQTGRMRNCIGSAPVRLPPGLRSGSGRCWSGLAAVDRLAAECDETRLLIDQSGEGQAEIVGILDFHEDAGEGDAVEPDQPGQVF